MPAIDQPDRIRLIWTDEEDALLVRILLAGGLPTDAARLLPWRSEAALQTRACRLQRLGCGDVPPSVRIRLRDLKRRRITHPRTTRTCRPHGWANEARA